MLVNQAGHASVDADWEPSAVKNLGLERWRYRDVKHLGGLSHRERALAQLKEAIREPSVSCVQQTEKFEEVTWVQQRQFTSTSQDTGRK